MKKAYRICACGILFFGIFSSFKLCGVKLYEIVKEGCLDEVKRFFEMYKVIPQRVLFNEFDKHGKSALYYACAQGNLAMVKYLYCMGASFHSEVSQDSSTALHIASKYGHEDIILFLLRNGVNPYRLNREQKSAYDFLHDTYHICPRDRLKYSQLFEFAAFWITCLKKKTAVRFFLEELEHYLSFNKNGDVNRANDNLKLGFLFAYNHGIIPFFNNLYYELYVKNYDDDSLKKIQEKNRDMLEILYGASQQFCSKKSYQIFFIENSLRDKNGEFCAGALDNNWEYNEKKLNEAIKNNFSSYQKEMLLKVMLGKKLSTFKSDINFYYLSCIETKKFRF